MGGMVVSPLAARVDRAGALLTGPVSPGSKVEEVFAQRIGETRTPMIKMEWRAGRSKFLQELQAQYRRLRGALSPEPGFFRKGLEDNVRVALSSHRIGHITRLLSCSMPRPFHFRSRRQRFSHRANRGADTQASTISSISGSTLGRQAADELGRNVVLHWIFQHPQLVIIS